MVGMVFKIVSSVFSLLLFGSDRLSKMVLIFGCFFKVFKFLCRVLVMLILYFCLGLMERSILIKLV